MPHPLMGFPPSECSPLEQQDVLVERRYLSNCWHTSEHWQASTGSFVDELKNTPSERSTQFLRFSSTRESVHVRPRVNRNDGRSSHGVPCLLRNITNRPRTLRFASHVVSTTSECYEPADQDFSEERPTLCRLCVQSAPCVCCLCAERAY
jgi:hypothetical protein